MWWADERQRKARERLKKRFQSSPDTKRLPKRAQLLMEVDALHHRAATRSRLADTPGAHGRLERPFGRPPTGEAETEDCEAHGWSELMATYAPKKAKKATAPSWKKAMNLYHEHACPNPEADVAPTPLLAMEANVRALRGELDNTRFLRQSRRGAVSSEERELAETLRFSIMQLDELKLV